MLFHAITKVIDLIINIFFVETKLTFQKLSNKFSFIMRIVSRIYVVLIFMGDGFFQEGCFAIPIFIFSSKIIKTKKLFRAIFVPKCIVPKFRRGRELSCSWQ